MEQVKGGDTAQLALLFERYHLGLFRYVLHLTRNRHLSEDLVQEVFFRVLKYARTYDSSFSFPVWIYGMARNAYFDWLRKNRAEVTSDGLAEVRSPDPMLEEVMTQKQDTAFLEEALQQLSQDKREVLVLSRFHEMRYEEIARILECEVGTVKVRVYRALKELRGKFCALRGEKLYDI
jgi:RNA polymerase sigma-70 factor (ECF subfamily)